jgi:hypothetical protein
MSKEEFVMGKLSDKRAAFVDLVKHRVGVK